MVWFLSLFIASQFSSFALLPHLVFWGQYWKGVGIVDLSLLFLTSVRLLQAFLHLEQWYLWVAFIVWKYILARALHMQNIHFLGLLSWRCWCWILSNVFSVSIEMIMWSFSLSTLMWPITFTYFYMLNHPWISDKLNWS